MRFTCPCCGYKSLAECEDTCELCGWINDPYQTMDPDQTVGPNDSSLRQAQYQFKQSHKGTSGFVKDKNWCAFAPPAATQKPAAAELVIPYFSAHSQA
ncbi:MAG: hypothetical protein CML06_08150 [Pseudomonadales bacterium]|nr:hypothetical protein [Pseudomonadales bacterium]